ncbi:hypothetical protein TcCL_NonESM09160 [Trypanosoma cruzi]|uniref:Uncharacterized protein n=1 Tax=Trypanosoma cruzi (strain CL Brener) TaxID=353153 RepID=Q4CS46_TRYCC|nr:hypothetical protein, conserved [Trypanosoma cruzi]EAN83097.1 hypothetical protein, conserved [Trypanosoma cruzi]RNC41275.1 hypothetical protein TcCL_NonESM09160 [Trypanosoma cruzi]|eukprot:XP_804948.1 hypothetical protein [Trypanosoma cruzi strain CL Brener]
MHSMGDVLTSEQEEAFHWRLNEARKAKDRGNVALEFGRRQKDSKKLREASFSYKKGCLLLTEYIPDTNESAGSSLQDMLVKRQAGARRHPLSEEQFAEIMELYVALQKNLALVNYLLGRHAEGVKCATTVLSISGHENDDKALLRRAHCNHCLGDLRAAETDLNTLERLSKDGNVPIDSAVPDLRRQIAKTRQQALEKERKMCAKMFA